MNAQVAKWSLIYPVHALRREWVPMYRSEIEAIDKLNSDDLLQYQLTKLSKLIQLCAAKNYINGEYNQLCGSLEDISALTCLPIQTKELYREHFQTRHRFPWQGIDCRSTSGSTGSPLTFYKDRLATGYMEAVQNYAYYWHGIKLGEPQGRFWGMPSGKKGTIARFKDMLKNRIRFSAFDLSDEAKYSFYRRLLRFRPTYFYGYPSLILELARFLNQEKLSLDTIPLKAVIGTGEYVYQEEKQELQELLGVPYVGEYGCSEVGVIGFDCPHGNMHVMSSNTIVEVVDTEGKHLAHDEEGEIVVTELNTRIMPFIRYRLGDRGLLSSEVCPCGRSLPVLKVSAGRKDDYIITPEGKKVYDAILAYTLKKGIRQFKAIQTKLDQLIIYVVADSNFSDQLKGGYIAQFQKVLNSSMKIEFVLVNEIERERSGKLRYFRSELGGKSI